MAYKNYDDICGKLRDDRRWLDDFFSGKRVETFRVKWGSRFSQDEIQESIYVILDGQAEIAEEYFVRGEGYNEKKDIFWGFRSYRPIRIVEVGDIIGDFSYIDRQLGLVGESRPGETWTIVCGARSAVFLSKKPLRVSDTYKYFRDDELLIANDGYDYEQTYGEHNHLKKLDKIVEIARLPTSDFTAEERDRFTREMIASTSWKRSYTYRVCPNSYNFNELFKFKYGASLQGGLYSNSTERKINGVHDECGYEATIETFLDSLFDAINRPIRQEPVFGPCKQAAAMYKNLGLFDDCLFPVRESKRQDIDTFYFPIGLTNFLLASYANNTNMTAKVRHGLTTSRGGKNRIFFWCRYANEIITFHKKLPASIDNLPTFDGNEIGPNTKKDFKEHWEDRFSKCVQNLDRYGLSLKAVILDTALHGKQLFLKYSRKKPAAEDHDS